MNDYYVMAFYDGYTFVWGVFDKLTDDLLCEFATEQEADSRCEYLNMNDYK